MGEKRGNRGQTQISFGVIFSIILIILFISFAVYGISKFMAAANLAKFEKFKSDFQEDIDKMWRSTQGSQKVEYIIPAKISQVCFQDQEDGNMYFNPQEKYREVVLLENLDITKTVAGSTGYPKKLCIQTDNGKISMTIKKQYNENLVTIAR